MKKLIFIVIILIAWAINRWSYDKSKTYIKEKLHHDSTQVTGAKNKL